jgi:hypothetical protein
LLSLWSNHRPNIIRRFFNRARVGADAATFMSLLSLIWARLSPGSLKMALHLSSKLRNAAVRPKPSTDEPIEWRVPQ